MNNPFDAMRAAIREARELNLAVDYQADALVDLLDCRMRSVSGDRLKRLKAQLRDFDMRTGTWKRSK